MKPSICLLILLGVFSLSPFVAGSQPLKPIQLEKPGEGKGKTLMQALQERKSSREFSERPLSLPQLSELLWAANGINRADGKRTAPSAVNKQMVELYVVLPEGVYRYDAAASQLAPVVAGDFRRLAGVQEFVYTAPVNLVFVADFGKWKEGRIPPREDLIGMAAIETGCQVQNVYLYCASEGLATVIRASVNKEELATALGLTADQYIVAAQTVGYPK